MPPPSSSDMRRGLLTRDAPKPSRTHSGHTASDKRFRSLASSNSPGSPGLPSSRSGTFARVLAPPGPMHCCTVPCECFSCFPACWHVPCAIAMCGGKGCFRTRRRGFMIQRSTFNSPKCARTGRVPKTCARAGDGIRARTADQSWDAIAAAKRMLACELKRCPPSPWPGCLELQPAQY